MSGFIDLHLHLLPGVDDGCKTLSESLQLARALVSLGYSQVAPSPHHRREHPSHDRALCERQRSVLRQALEHDAVPLTVHLNAENYFLDESLLEELSTQTLRTLGTGKVLLIEAPYQGPLPTLTELIFRMKLKGVTPLIAHPERCAEFERKGRAMELVQAGALLQLDMGALIGRYGKTAEKLAKQFLDDELYAVAATDAHSPVKVEAWVEPSLVALERRVGRAELERLLRDRPAKLLAGVVD